MEKIIRIKLENNEVSYGGNQRWFCDETLQKYGCGLVSCGDILLCRTEKREEFSKEEYLSFSKNLSENFFKVRKRLGLNGLSMTFGMNRFFKKNKLPYKAKWGAFKKNIIVYIEKMLKSGIPVCLSIGPNLYRKPCGVGFYSSIEDKIFSRENVCDHYVTVTDLFENNGEKWLVISSWGKKFFVRVSDYFDYKRKFLTGFSNILVIKERK